MVIDPLNIPFRGRFNYSRAERVADGAVHAVGIVLAIAAGAALLALSPFYVGAGEYVAAVFYVASLLTVLSVSFAYNQWPVSPAKWVLRRFDHAGIYLLIAGTYTPFIAQLDDPWTSVPLAAIVWGGAAIGIAIKLLLPGRFDRLAVVFYLAIGWSGVIMAGKLAAQLPSSTLTLIAAGGIVYSLGVIFYAWTQLRFQNALWHGFVVAGATLHLAAVTDSMVLNRL